MNAVKITSLLFIIFAYFTCNAQPKTEKPNVIFILTDDQGYGDMGCHGNPWIKTPHLDELHSESIRFTNFHVGTTCAPSRAGLLTGNYCNKVGVWHTVKGREILNADQLTLAEVFKNAGYATGIFGKWHLGDNYPYRPQDRGFDKVLLHGGGGVGQTPDYWNNDYFDDTYFRNGEPEKFVGYCTDIWFEEAKKFIKNNKEKPFFCYLSTNAPHSPYRVEDKYSQPYMNNDSVPNPYFYGMIANIDENIGKLRDFLKDENLVENTILVFMTDNGTAAGVDLDKNGRVIRGYNAGMRGKKASAFEGGHRVPFFIYWGKEKLNTGKDINVLSSYIDFMPTVLELCGIKTNKKNDFDGKSLVPLFYKSNISWPERILFTDTQREENLTKYKDYCIMTDRWRLLNGGLYDIKNDPGQFYNVAKDFPEVVANLNKAYERWWKLVSVNKDSINALCLGSDNAPRVTLTSHDLHAEKGVVPWSQVMVRLGNGGAIGHWVVKIAKSGLYQFELQRWPVESGLKLKDPATEGEPVPGDAPYPKGKALYIKEAWIKIGEQEFRNSINDGAEHSIFNIKLEKGTYKLYCRFKDIEENMRDAYYVYVSYQN